MNKRHFFILSYFLLSSTYFITCDEGFDPLPVTKPPIVTITNPNNNSTVKDTIIIEYQVSNINNNYIVVFYIDADTIGIKDSLHLGYFQFNTNKYDDGSKHNIILKLFNNSENLLDIDSLFIIVNNQNPPPMITITFPNNNSTVKDTILIEYQENTAMNHLTVAGILREELRRWHSS